eukprot:CAMPEP_0181219872 /NCGR_PEP_ID=MMETSP1096-20121128/28524_1 /TAXON_ID=156174 ORGANISM="Chrysochromulina ericina, Strain CCMP281" /NCGR_SAMPLE_ID=MMETSP1096 /ASSEMBLY_ACC=CAM_ASM_000453 /LENGTH=61 /DNA_ID=CAMNT_0023312315 /DNA_START=416 /DNA_END=600 /DNA_ORIENTATION=-
MTTSLVASAACDMCRALRPNLVSSAATALIKQLQVREEVVVGPEPLGRAKAPRPMVTEPFE